MQTFVLIDRERLRFVKRCPSVRQCEYWAALSCKDRDFVIFDMARKNYAAFSMMELAQLYFQAIGGPGGRINGYEEAVKLCASTAETLPVDDTTEDDLSDRLGHVLPPTNVADGRIHAGASVVQHPEYGNTGKVEAKAGKSKKMEVTVTEQPVDPSRGPAKPTKVSKSKTPKSDKPKAPKVPRDPSGRPASGTSTGKVWDIADKLSKGVKDVTTKEFRTKVVEACVKEGINQSTAGVQFGKWKGSK